MFLKISHSSPEALNYVTAVSYGTFFGAICDLGLSTIGFKRFKGSSHEFKIKYVMARLILSVVIFTSLSFFNYYAALFGFIFSLYSVLVSPAVLNFVQWRYGSNLAVFIGRLLISLLLIAAYYFEDFDISAQLYILMNCVVVVFVFVFYNFNLVFSKESLLLDCRWILEFYVRYWRSMLLPVFVVLTTTGLPLVITFSGVSETSVVMVFLIERVCSLSKFLLNFLLQRLSPSSLRLRRGYVVFSALISVVFCIFGLLLFNLIPGYEVGYDFFPAAAILSLSYGISFYVWYCVLDDDSYERLQFPLKVLSFMVLVFLIFFFGKEAGSIIYSLAIAELAFSLFPLFFLIIKRAI
ncbi:hypothetical protein [Halomonas sp. S2151]|uniref:hypothetical protein n=1 Tax=Halomonas sp. S2151 TaxID=579478 RepID=UPI0012EE8CD5|nr:hypothetical protein [Halomonas sp. S2151]